MKFDNEERYERLVTRKNYILYKHYNKHKRVALESDSSSESTNVRATTLAVQRQGLR
jgi:hypothetical protein